MRKIGLIGFGVVGNAVYENFKNKFEVIIYDKYKKEYADNFSKVVSPGVEAVFVCVPTPTLGEVQDTKSLQEVLKLLTDAKYRNPVVVKSTILPGTLRTMREIMGFDLNLVHNPEFLKAANAVEDFAFQESVLLGTDSEYCFLLVRDIYLTWKKSLNVYMAAPEETEFVKYMHNVFLAAKVSLFNEFYMYYRQMKPYGRSFQDTVHLLLNATENILPNHTQVPGPDGKYGYGGMCFPKDTKALLGDYEALGLKNTILERVVSMNDVHRSIPADGQEHPSHLSIVKDMN